MSFPRSQAAPLPVSPLMTSLRAGGTMNVVLTRRKGVVDMKKQSLGVSELQVEGWSDVGIIHLRVL